MQCAQCQHDITDKGYVVTVDDEYENSEIEICKECYQEWLKSL